ncbi:MAG: phytoene/squalene synthase family protein [Deltaproteobacteria bacterium]|nr:phytoene/squalene synthase family protein [Deltaproteobacteria bacterium]
MTSESTALALRLSPADLQVCRQTLAAGSKTFHAASRALPARLQDPVTALYTFCRIADDLVDDGPSPAEGVRILEGMLDRAYAGAPGDSPTERALAWVVGEHRLPRPALDALIEGFVWDAEGRRYETLDEVRAYGVRVAGTVGVMMTLLMGRRAPEVLARACDLGVAMQLTNIARDVGEDARRGRIYLPEAWLRAEGVDPDALRAEPRFSPGVGKVVEALLEEAERLYRSADQGIPHLPRDGRVAIRAARLIYSDIGREIRRRGFDSVSGRAVVSRPRKAWLLLRSLPAYLSRARPLQGAPLEVARPLLQACTP